VAVKRKRSQKIDPDTIFKSPFMRAFFILTPMKFFLVCILCCMGLLVSCKKDTDSGKLTPACDGSHPTYQSDIKNIIDSRCTSSGCHPDFASYEGLFPKLQGGDFEREVLVNQTMPDGAPLTQEQINKIQCWVNDGYPEN